jgi:hypothetical protein
MRLVSERKGDDIPMTETVLETEIEPMDQIPTYVLPARFRGTRFDVNRSLRFEIGPWTWTAVPPVGVFGDQETIDVSGIIDRPTSWLILKRSSQRSLQGMELEVTPAREQGTVKLRILRNSGRTIAEGVARAGKKGIDFEVETTGIRMPKRDKAVFRGTFHDDGRLRMKATGLRPRPTEKS